MYTDHPEISFTMLNIVCSLCSWYFGSLAYLLASSVCGQQPDQSPTWTASCLSGCFSYPTVWDASIGLQLVLPRRICRMFASGCLWFLVFPSTLFWVFRVSSSYCPNHSQPLQANNPKAKSRASGLLIKGESLRFCFPVFAAGRVSFQRRSACSTLFNEHRSRQLIEELNMKQLHWSSAFSLKWS